MRYMRVLNGTTPNISEIRQLHPNISIPENADLTTLGYLALSITPKPAANPGHYVVEGAPEFVSGGWRTTWVQIPYSGVQIMAQIVEATQKRLDDFAKTRNYDGILSACTYAASSIPKFADEGMYCVNARDATWATLYDILNAVQAQTRQLPTGFAEIESELPVLAWPV